MRTPSAGLRNRREFLGSAMRVGAASIVGLQSASLVSSVLGLESRAAAAEPPPEVKKIRLVRHPVLCLAPQYVAEEFFYREGFTEVQYIPTSSRIIRVVAVGDADMTMDFAASMNIRVDEGYPVTMLAGVHPGCFDLFGSRRVRRVRDLKGKAVGVPALGGAQHFFFVTVVAQVGLNPRKDINFVIQPDEESMRQLAAEKIDGMITFPPSGQELRARKIGHVVVNGMMDRPWSGYHCCLVAGHREFLRQYPVATKRALRAILKGADLCVREPQRVARFLVDRGYARDYAYTLQVMREMPFGRWRDYDPEDTVRFFALRLREAGMIASSPQRIIDVATDWRIFNELKTELKP